MIIENHSLKKYNTFGIDVSARYFSVAENEDQLLDLISEYRKSRSELLILGGGSNLLFTKNFDGLVIKLQLPGITELEENADTVLVKAGAGVVWHELVMKCVSEGWGGVENMSLIPGSTGAGPMQNIGAYGTEIKDVFEYLEAIHIESGLVKKFNANECEFGYRSSIFKNKVKGEYIITGVALRLNKNTVLNTSYGAIENELNAMGIRNPGIRDVSNAVINIRQSKLPDPTVLGNAGSFFKNPEVDLELFEKLKISFPEIPGYPTVPGKIKLAAGWLIEQCGWKGKVVGNTGAHKMQALVLVNYGKASGSEIRDLAFNILDSVQEKFGVKLEPEVNII